MKTAIVISDSHGNLRAIRKLYEIMEESDYVFHLGDYRRDIDEFEERFPEKVYSVYGNCDGYSGEGEVTIEGVKVFYTLRYFLLFISHVFTSRVCKRRRKPLRLFYIISKKQKKVNARADL